jgi:hypothetical protein
MLLPDWWSLYSDSTTMLRNGLSPILAAIVLLVAASSSAADRPHFTVMTDDAVTTVSIAVNLAVDQTWRGTSSSQNHIVLINDYFAEWINHPLVSHLRELIYSGQTGFPYSIGLHYDAPSFRPNGFRSTRVISAELDHLGPDLWAFYHDANVGVFLAEHRRTFSEAEGLLSERMAVDTEIEFLEDFWGYQFSEYRVIPVPTLPAGTDRGATLRNETQTVACFLVGPETSLPDDQQQLDAILLGYHMVSRIESTAVHEFCHSFYGTLLAEIGADLSEAARVFWDQTTPIDGYGPLDLNWAGYVEEYIVRAVDALHADLTLGTHRAQDFLQCNEQLGFGAIRYFYDHIRNYYDRRTEYDGFMYYVPEIIDDLNAYNEAT